ncbi:ATP synthase regulation protein NCA2-domain-containing protein [Rhodocollybia butyracea]|uniref:ATP synthase regulation protein NCA2-domain-containing protein n=1 Tax=Rhodocollybia butyracea TaxID=206335 RepID=A0A9P5PQX1_9AGAR|nr:ATP synthase regulation protein NCA2-domain-containing protein [Rhodocollybia butyracea]
MAATSDTFNASSGGDVIFRSSDGVLFFVHKDALGYCSGGFPDGDAITVDPEPVPLTESSSVLEILFQFVYPRKQPALDDMKFSLFLAVAEAAEKYEVYFAMNICQLRMNLSNLWFCWKHNYPYLIAAASPLLIGKPLTEIARVLPPHLFVPWKNSGNAGFLGAQTRVEAGESLSSDKNWDSLDPEDEAELTRQVFVSLYAQALDITLQQALEAEREANWWADVERSRWKAFSHLVETLPLRLCDVLRIAKEDIEIANSCDLSLCLLPCFLIFEINRKSLRIHGCVYQASAHPYPRFRLSALCTLKKHQLLHIRDERAQTLGSLVLLRPDVQKVFGMKPESTELIATIQRVLSAVDRSAEESTTTESSFSSLTQLSSLSRITTRASSQNTLHSLNLTRPSRLTQGTIRDFVAEAQDVVRGFVIDWCVKPLMGVLDTVKASRAGEGEGWLVTKEGSLERMALALASDHLRYSPTQLTELSDRVRLGDLTPVLKLYEEDIKSPVRNALGGTLLRTVFIQVQKAKVDLDQALSGIDRLMKSQELTFAFVGLFSCTSNRLRRWRLHATTAFSQSARGVLALRRVERVLVLDGKEKQEDGAKGKGAEFGQVGETGHPSALTTGLLILSLTQLRTYAEKYLPSSGSPSSPPPANIPGSSTLYSTSTSAPLSSTAYSASSFRDAFLEDLTDLQDPELGVDQKRAVVERMWRCWSSPLGLGTSV